MFFVVRVGLLSKQRRLPYVESGSLQTSMTVKVWPSTFMPTNIFMYFLRLACILAVMQPGKLGFRVLGTVLGGAMQSRYAAEALDKDTLDKESGV